jgi:hypothetical protein
LKGGKTYLDYLEKMRKDTSLTKEQIHQITNKIAQETNKNITDTFKQTLSEQLTNAKTVIDQLEIIQAMRDELNKPDNDDPLKMQKQEIVEDADKGVQDKLKNEVEELQKQYADYDQKRRDIENKFTADLVVMYDKNGNLIRGFTQVNVNELKRQQQETLKALDDEVIEKMRNTSGFLVQLFEDASEKSIAEINKIMQMGEELISYLSQTNNEDITPKFGFTAEQLKILKSSPEEINKIQKALNELYNAGAKKNPFAALINELKNLFKTGNGNDPQKLEAKLANVGSAAAKVGAQVGDIAGKLSDMFEAAGNDSLAQAASDIQDVMTSVSNIGQGFAEGGIAGGIMAAVVEVINWTTKAFEATARHKAAMEEILREANAQQHAYNLLLLQQNLEYERAATILGTDSYGKAAEAVNVLKKSVAGLNKELAGTDAQKAKAENSRSAFGNHAKLKENSPGLADIEVKTGHEKTGLFGWGKGRDVYSSILDVYPELIEANGDFNASLAKTILQARTMSEEDKVALQRAIDYAEMVKQAYEEVKNYFTDIFGELGGNISDALVDAFRNGTDAAEKFSQSVTGMLEKLAQDMIYNVTLIPLMEKAQDAMLDVMNNGNLTNDEKFDQFVGILDNVLDDAIEQQEVSNKLYEKYQQMAKERDIDLWKPEDDEATPKSLSGAIKGASQASIDLLAGQTNAVRVNQVESIEIMRNSLIQLTMINANTNKSSKHLESLDNKIGNNQIDPLRSQGIAG